MINAHYLENYKNFISFERRLSEHTVKNYFRDIDMLINHFSNPPNNQEKKEEKQNPKV